VSPATGQAQAQKALPKISPERKSKANMIKLPEIIPSRTPLNIIAGEK
jgi:hypothetical protein